MSELTVPMAEARLRCLVFLVQPGSSLRAAGFGRMAFPLARFRTAQGAAFASAKLRHQMLGDGVIRPHWGVRGEYVIAARGCQEADLFITAAAAGAAGAV